MASEELFPFNVLEQQLATATMPLSYFVQEFCKATIRSHQTLRNKDEVLDPTPG
jgi:hypothetical protein